MEIKKERWIPYKPRSITTNWNKDIFYEVCSILLHDCAVLELVCLQFCDYMSSNDLWVRLYNCIYYPESKNLPKAENIRDEFYSPLYHWDEDLFVKFCVPEGDDQPIYDLYTYLDLRFHDDRRTIDCGNARWKTIKCLEPLPRTEGRFFCFAMDVIRCEANSSYVGFGICPLAENNKYDNPPYGCPWIWHTLQGAVFKKGGQVGLVGCVKEGYYLLNFFINNQFYPWYKYDHKYNDGSSESYYISAEKEVFIHFAIATGEKFTITRPKLGNYYYYNMFKNSDAYKEGILYRGSQFRSSNDF